MKKYDSKWKWISKIVYVMGDEALGIKEIAERIITKEPGQDRTKMRNMVSGTLTMHLRKARTLIFQRELHTDPVTRNQTYRYSLTPASKTFQFK